MTPEGELFDEYSGDYDATVQRAIWASGESVEFFASLRADIIARIAGRTSESLEILDFGCGIGNMTRQVARRFPKAKLVGMDVSEESLRRAHALSTETGDRLQFRSNTGGRLPLEDASVDVAFTSGVFHHIEPEQRPKWARELRRVLKPGGLFFLFEHNPLNPLTVRVVRNTPFDEGVVLLNARYSVRLLTDAGFQSRRPEYYFFFPHFLRALRPLERLLRHAPIGAQYFVVGRA